MTEHHEPVTIPPAQPAPQESADPTDDLTPPSAAEIAQAVATTEELNDADQEYVSEIAALHESAPAADAEGTAAAPAATTDAPAESAESAESVSTARTPAGDPAAGEAPTVSDAAAEDTETPSPANEAPAGPAAGTAPQASPASRPGGPGRPGGRPTPGGPRRPTPVARPVGADAAPGAPAVAVSELVETSDPTPWGRVDDDGTVYVITADGERPVGVWQAGAPMAGLAHYGRRFDDFMTEIVVLENRIAGHSGDPKAARTHAQMLRQSIDTLPAVGDFATAAARLDAVIAAAEQLVTASAKDKANAKAAAVSRREALCEEAEALAESTQWKAGGDRLKEIVEEWRTIRGIDRKTDDLLWKRFSKARDTFIRRRGSHFAEMDKERGAAKSVKEKLIARAEALSDSTEWGETAGEYRDLMAEWKAAGRTSRDVEDALWNRFRTAQEKFFSRRQETFASRDAEFEANAAVKEELLVEAERIDPAAGLDAAKAALRSIQDRWEAAGKVPRERIRTLDARLRAVEDKVKSAEESLWRRTDPETTARLAQFRSRYESFQAQADKATAAGDAKRAAAAQAQADQWLEWLQAAENAVD